MATKFPTGTMTLVFTDLEGSSELSEKHGAHFEATRMEHYEVLRAAVACHGGYEVETAGDALFVVFAEASSAIQFAVDAQLAMAAHPWPPEVGTLRVRIGMHTGTPYIGEDQGRPTYRGPATNRAARVQSAAHGGQTIVSDTTATTAAILPPEISLLDCGAHRLKGVGEMRLWQVCHPQLPAVFPPLNTLSPERHNLPTPSTPIIGREVESAALRDWLCAQNTRLLTLLAFGGMGKTRLALQVAEQCVEKFANGVWWVNLDERRSAEGMIDSIALALRLHPQPDIPLKEQLLKFLRERHLLLVLDNTEQIADAARVIHELLQAAPRLQCLVTSRRALNLSIEKVHEIPPLPLDEAARLFLERARARREEFPYHEYSSDIEEVCRRLECVPLAIELAASRTASLTPRDILRHLDQRFKVLQTRAPDLPPRQRALRGAIDWSYDLLSEDDQSLFAQLSVFARSFTLDDAEAVCEALDVFEGAQELRSQSLLRVEVDAATHQTRFSMLEAVRDYAAEKLLAIPELDSQVRERHAAYFQSFAQARISKLRTPDEAPALREMETYLDNMRAALQWTCGSARPALCARLSLELGIFLQKRGLINQAARTLDIGLQTSPQIINEVPALIAQLWRERAGLFIDTLETEAALSSAHKALLIFAQLEDGKGEADATNLLGLATKRDGKWDDARLHFQNALELYDSVGDEIGAAIVRTNLGATECEDPNGDKDSAKQLLREALQVRHSHGDERGVAEVLNNLGVLAQETNHFEEAERYYEEALPYERKLQNTNGVARVLYNLSEIAEARSDYARAVRCAVASAYLFNDIGSPLRRYADALCARVAPSAGVDETLLHEQIKAKHLNNVVEWALTSG